MRPVFTSNARAFLLSVAAATLLTTSAYADCTYELFNIASVKGTSVGDFIDQISDECGISVIVTDSEAENMLKKQMSKTYLKNLTINEVLDLIIKENNLQYTLQNNVLKIAYLTTKTYQIDYISGERRGEGSTNVTLSSQSNTGGTPPLGGAGAPAPTVAAGGAAGAVRPGASSQSGVKITSTDEVKFWADLDNEIKSILNRPEDSYRQNNALDQNSSDVHHIYINKSAGMVTVSGTSKQLQRLDAYIDDLQKKMQTQVLIDVKIYSVVFNNSSSTGIDWSQIYNLQNFNLAFNKADRTNVAGSTFATAYEGDGVQELRHTSDVLNPITNVMDPVRTLVSLAGARAPVEAVSKLFSLSHSVNINNLLMFLKTQGDVYSISNPKILTLNNQPALITAGTELFYKIINTNVLAGGTTGTSATTEIISSVFAGVLLDITPEISRDGSITLRINPSVSETASVISADNTKRTMPPDLSRRQLSSVVTVKDGSRIVLGGLINRKTSTRTTKVPLLGDIPVLGYLFKQENPSETVEELVIIIEPHIIKKESDTLTLSDLGYSRLSNDGQKIEETKK